MNEQDVDESVKLNVLMERFYEFDSIMEPALRKEIIEDLISVGEPAVEYLIEALERGHLKVQKNAERLFRSLENERGLILVLDSYSRVDVSLGNIKRRNIVEKIDEWVSHVRSSAACALGRIGDKRAIESLIRAIEDDDAALRASAAFALGELGDIHAVEALINTLDDDEKEIKINTAQALGKMGDSRAIEPLLMERAGGDSDFQKTAEEALKSLCGSITAVIFGKPAEKNDLRVVYINPEASNLTLPLRSLSKIIIYIETFDFRKLERFVTYALNYIGREYLKNNVEVYIHGEHKKLPHNLRNLFKDLFKNLKEA
jgi:HEAT repeat protein